MSACKSALPLLVWLMLILIPHPSGLTANAWSYHALFVAVVVGLVLEPIPASAVGLVGVAFATALGYVASDPAEARNCRAEWILLANALAHVLS